MNLAWDLETAPEKGSVEKFVTDAEPVRELLDESRDAAEAHEKAVAGKRKDDERAAADAIAMIVSGVVVDKACEPMRKATKSGWRHGKTKNPVLLRAAMAKDYGELVDKATTTCSLDPFLGRIVSAAVAGRLPGCEVASDVRTIADFDMDEAAHLRWQWGDYISHVDSLVTWNGVGFDAVFMMRRSMLLGVPVPRSIETRFRYYSPVCDLMQWCTAWGKSKSFMPDTYIGSARPHRAGLDHICVVTGLGESKGGMSGDQVAQFVEDERWPEIGAYNLGDVLSRTWPLYERIAPYIPGHEAYGRALQAKPAPPADDGTKEN